MDFPWCTAGVDQAEKCICSATARSAKQQQQQQKNTLCTTLYVCDVEYVGKMCETVKCSIVGFLFLH